MIAVYGFVCGVLFTLSVQRTIATVQRIAARRKEASP